MVNPATLAPVTASTPTESRLPSHIPALDGIRGFAVILVVIRHTLSWPMEISAHPGNWQFLFWYWTKMMWVGVDLFFVLSGFLITKILLENQNSPRLFRTFYTRRACRILPLYFLLVAVAYLARALLPHTALWQKLFEFQPQWYYYATLTQNIFMGPAGTTGGIALAVTWSLAVEEQFYLVLPAVTRFFPKTLLPWLFAGGIPCALLIRLHWNDARSYYWSPSHADSLLIGCLLAWVCLQPRALAWLQRQVSGLNLLLGILLCGMLVINQMPEFYQWFSDTWFSLCFGVILLISVTQPQHWLTRFLGLRWLRYTGDISYAVYLLHFPILAVLFWLLRGTTPAINTVADLLIPALTVVITIALASLSLTFFEKRWIKLGHRAKY